nr:MAG TPA: hypothetical protein [Caudoviricetes sp.]
MLLKLLFLGEFLVRFGYEFRTFTTRYSATS